jgi:hypothetical protein
MSVSSDSNDASDIFWPGYVDAVTNLAINLLFVIAVMSIVVLGFTLQLAQMTKNKVVTETTSPQKSNGAAAEDIYVKSNEDDAKANANKASATVDATTAAKIALKEIQKQLSTAQQAVQQVQSQAAQTELKQALSQAENDAKQLKQQLEKSEQIKKQSEKVQTETQKAQQSPLQSEKIETVKAEQQKITPAAGEKAAQSSIAGGLVVKFSPDVVELAQAEASELVNKLNSAGSLANKHWQIQVISPKGFSEAARLAYYRVNAVRNVLLQNGVPAAAIDLRISESADPAADNSVVAVRQMP